MAVNNIIQLRGPTKEYKVRDSLAGSETVMAPLLSSGILFFTEPFELITAVIPVFATLTNGTPNSIDLILA